MRATSSTLSTPYIPIYRKQKVHILFINGDKDVAGLSAVGAICSGATAVYLSACLNTTMDQHFTYSPPLAPMYPFYRSSVPRPGNVRVRRWYTHFSISILAGIPASCSLSPLLAIFSSTTISAITTFTVEKENLIPGDLPTCAIVGFFTFHQNRTIFV